MTLHTTWIEFYFKKIKILNFILKFKFNWIRDPNWTRFSTEEKWDANWCKKHSIFFDYVEARSSSAYGKEKEVEIIMSYSNMINLILTLPPLLTLVC
jgi:hypothetical protein